ncbi:oxygen-dependent coproporphyrinogen oxidase [Rudanella lutea]|uniref:oxygen-dependent coproporphyrinogen oxidase n=1 Tax=Rudanella lutea TaxID=451374 RepID=UPI00037A15CE|nr:oxygen-dependent coproporphyrinogen oxidase [Rudanella lutea]
MTKEDIAHWFGGLQDRICQVLETADGVGRFGEDSWERPGGGGGRSRTLANGAVIEKGGVGFSVVHGEATEGTLRQLGITAQNGEVPTFFATGVSIVLHPHSPMVPIIHMNVRYFEMSTGHNWFGGGIDLTPHYVAAADARWFHEQLKAVCDKHNPDYYPRFKPWADDYFYLKHRQETRGIGGIFFDHLRPESPEHKAELFSFVQDVGNAFAPIYTHFMQQNRDLPYGETQKAWQMLRRGRYVEFNLVWDRGTKFGLETDGRTESILMSMPPQANWTYNHQPQPGSEEARTLSLLRKGIDWVGK